jgi:hypothetical protein
VICPRCGGFFDTEEPRTYCTPACRKRARWAKNARNRRGRERVAAKNCWHKKGYASKADARAALRYKPPVLQPYRCLACGLWHLTSCSGPETRAAEQERKRS